MKLYALLDDLDEIPQLVGVFSTEQKAREYGNGPHRKFSTGAMQIAEVTVDYPDEPDMGGSPVISKIGPRR